MENVEGQRQLIASIFKCAALDVVACPTANPDIEIPYRKGGHKDCSADAQRFLNLDNPAFNYYCRLLDFEPDYTLKKILEFIKNEIALRHQLNIQKKALEKFIPKRKKKDAMQGLRLSNKSCHKNAA